MLLTALFDGRLPQAVFFDLDGTLIDSVPDLACAIDQMLQALGLPLAGVDNVHLWVGNGAQVLVERAITWACKEQDVDVDIDREKSLQMFLDFYALAAGHSTLYPNVLTLLNYLHRQKIPLVLITNKPRRFTPAILLQHQIEHVFELLLCGDDLADKKPHPAQILHAVQTLGLEAGQCLMVGDSVSDIDAAVAAKVKSVAVTYGYNHGVCAKTLNADAFVDDLAELLV
ncbi:MAG: phosphoglycolate phosphatase [Pseudomonadales bacterium]|nr:phosphoglycolate phosphatase [Pseudomonadales bacterium]